MLSAQYFEMQGQNTHNDRDRKLNFKYQCDERTRPSDSSSQQGTREGARKHAWPRPRPALATDGWLAGLLAQAPPPESSPVYAPCRPVPRLGSL